MTSEQLNPCGGTDANICDNADCPTCTAYLKEDATLPKPQISEARIAANLKNAQSSTGPKSAAGKATVSQNAVKTALTGRTVLLPFDNVHAYQELLSEYVKEFTPVGPIERGLVQSLVDTCWRLERIPGLEYALLENGYNQFGHEDPARTLATPEATLEMLIRQIKEKDFRNLALQENRLVRRREREMKELRELQSVRNGKEEEELKQAAQLALLAQNKKEPFNVAELGFVFSAQRFAQYMARLTPAMKNNLLREAISLTSQPKSAVA